VIHALDVDSRGRGRIAKIEKKTKRYPGDLTDEEWSAVEPFLPKLEATGSPRRTDLRKVLNAIGYLVRSGCEWRMLPVHFPPGGRCTVGGFVR
jgi:putative transposase